jgi:hypothetical protein
VQILVLLLRCQAPFQFKLEVKCALRLRDQVIKVLLLLDALRLLMLLCR